MKRHPALALGLLSALLLCTSAEARHGRGAGASGGGSAPSAPTNVQMVLIGQSTPGVSNNLGTYPNKYNTSVSVNLAELAWQSSAGADHYNIHRCTNSGCVSYATITSATAASGYSTCVSNGECALVTNINSAYQDTSATNILNAGYVTGNQNAPMVATGTISTGSNALTIGTVSTGAVTIGAGIGGVGIPLGTTIVSGSGTSWVMSNNATANATLETIGRMYFQTQPYTYYVTAVTSGVESTASAYAYLPFFANGNYVMSGGVFNGTIITGATAPATTPLGYSKAMEWTGDNDGLGSIINPYSGENAPSQNLPINGYNYLIFSFYPIQSGVTLQIAPELIGDQLMYSGPINIPNGTWGCPQPFTANTWNTCKIPLTAIYQDMLNGVTGIQPTFYKNTYTYDYGSVPNLTAYTEMSFTVN